MPIDKSNLKLDNAKEIVRLSEVYLDGTVRLALAADARAISLTGMLVTSFVALMAAGFSLLFYQTHLLRINCVLGIAAFGAGLCLLGGVWQATSAAMPRPFSVGGNYLQNWDREELCGDLIGPMLGQAESYQNEIAANQLRLQTGATYLRRALICVIASPLFAIFFGLAAYFGFPQVLQHLLDPGLGCLLDSVS